MGTEDLKVTAINMYNYKERLRLFKRWPCSTFINTRESTEDQRASRDSHTLPHEQVAGSARGGGNGIPVYPKKFAKIPKNTENSSKYTQN